MAIPIPVGGSMVGSHHAFSKNSPGIPEFSVVDSNGASNGVLIRRPEMPTTWCFVLSLREILRVLSKIGASVRAWMPDAGV